MVKIQELLGYDTLPSCEEAFCRVSDIASELEIVSKNLATEAKKLGSAAALGNITALRKAKHAIGSISEQAKINFASIAAFDEAAVSRAIGTRQFLQEVVDAAAKIGLTSARLTGNSILAFPNRLSVDDKGIRLGKKIVTAVRPSAIARALKQDAEKATTVPESFINSLRAAYEVKARGSDMPVSIDEIYDVLTLLPDAKKSYTEADFVRDLSVIDAFGPHESSDGHRISFVNATSTRMGKGLRAVSPNGEDVTYMNLRFIASS